MYKRLSADERKQRLFVLREEQRVFLEYEMKRGRRTVFENVMRDEKISALKSVDIKLQEEEMNVADWLIFDYDDFGPGNLDGQCACGRRLRYMFTIEHQITHKKIQYGKDHLSTFLNIEVNEIDGVIHELDKIDYEIDEILWKIEEDEYYYEYYERLPDKTVVSKSIKKHFQMNVPFLDRQINRLTKHFEKQIEIIEEKQRNIQQEVEREKRQESRKRIEELLKEKKKIDDMLEAERKAQQESEYKRQNQENERVERLLKEKREKVDRLIETVKEQLRYDATFNDIAYLLVLNGQHSAVEISHIMANDFGFNKSISIGEMKRPFIYMDVLLALKKYVVSGNLIMDESSNIEDCIFYVNPYLVEDNFDKNVEVHQQSLF